MVPPSARAAGFASGPHAAFALRALLFDAGVVFWDGARFVLHSCRPDRFLVEVDGCECSFCKVG